MLPEQIAGLAPALTQFLSCFRKCLGECRLMDHFRIYCRGLLSNLSRKSVEPIALAAGSTVRALQMFLTKRTWDHLRLRDCLQQRIVSLHAPVPGAIRLPDDLGVIGLIDETSVAKKGDKTPGVQRQYCGASGKIDNCVVTVHLGYAHGPFQSLLDSELYLPRSWDQDRQRCREASIPDDLVYQPKTVIALALVERALGNGVKFDWQVFDEGYGRDPSFLLGLDALGQTWIGEVPKNFRCWPVLPQHHSSQSAFASKQVYNVVRWSPAFIYQDWQAIIFPRQTVEPAVWDVKAAQVHLVHKGRPTDRTYWLIVAWNRATDEHKYFVSNAPPKTPVELLLKVAFRRAVIEQLFRLSKSEVGLGHFEGRSYVGLMRHMILCQLIVVFLAEQTIRLNAEITAAAEVPAADLALPAATQVPAAAPCAKKKVRQGPARDGQTPMPPGADHHASDLAAYDHGTDGNRTERAVLSLA